MDIIFSYVSREVRIEYNLVLRKQKTWGPVVGGQCFGKGFRLPNLWIFVDEVASK